MTCSPLSHRRLHDAAAAGDAAKVGELLAGGEDPTLRHIAFGFKVPYDVSADGATRDAFRRFCGASPGAWNWERAHVPSGLTEAAEEERREAAHVALSEPLSGFSCTGGGGGEAGATPAAGTAQALRPGAFLRRLLAASLDAFTSLPPTRCTFQ